MALKEVKGQISDISIEKRKIAIETKERVFVILEWGAGLDRIMEKQKEHWFVQVTYEETNGVNTINTIAYWEKPADWPVRHTQSGGRKPYGKSTEERKDIRLMACLKAATELFVSQAFSDEAAIEELTYESACDMVAKQAVRMEGILESKHNT